MEIISLDGIDTTITGRVGTVSLVIDSTLDWLQEEAHEEVARESVVDEEVL
jgi:hypothetical protein